MDTERALLNFTNYNKAAQFQIPLFKYFAIKRFLKDLSWQFVRYKLLQSIDHNKLFLLGQDWRQLVERYQNIEEKIKSLKIEVIQNQREIQSQLSKNIYKQYPNLTFHMDQQNALHIVKHYNDQLTEEQLQNFRQRYEIVKQKLEFSDHPFYQKIYWQYLSWNSKEMPFKIFSQFGVQYEQYTIQIEKDCDFQNFEIIGNRNQIANVKQHILNLLKQQVLEDQSVEIGPYFLTQLGENQI